MLSKLMMRKIRAAGMLGDDQKNSGAECSEPTVNVVKGGVTGVECTAAIDRAGLAKLDATTFK